MAGATRAVPDAMAAVDFDERVTVFPEIAVMVVPVGIPGPLMV